MHSHPLSWPDVASTAASRLSVTVVDDLAAVEPTWRKLEADAICTPFQRFDWISAYAATIGRAHGRAIRVLLAHDAHGELAFILPLEIETRMGARVACVPGGRHANLQMPLLSAHASGRLIAADLRPALKRAARDVGSIDAIHLRAQPGAWNGHPNPFAAGAISTGERLHRILLDSDPAETLNRTVGRDSRKKLRQKRRRLEALGKIEYRAAEGPDDSDAILETFFAQKAHRLAAQGIHNPFVGPTRAFLHRAVRAGADGHVAVDVHAMTLDSRIVAVFGATSDARSACGMFNSFDGDAQLWRMSVGHLLLVEVIAHYARTGRRHFDLGVGEAPYKDTFCERTEPIVETILPLTVTGMGYAMLARAALVAKRVIKRSPPLLAALRRWGPRGEHSD